jgi:nanoRNase/pAp phosphatase (c-di-AMP/oligoRNAs hydrolase)
MTTRSTYTDRLAGFKHRLEGASSVLILTHDFPDPDCLASAFGLVHLFSFWGMKSSTISFGGFIGRAENRAMVRFAQIESVPYMLINLADHDRIVLVDTFPGLGNLSLDKGAKVDAVFDHHPHKVPASAGYFHDVRSELGATSTLITKYLLESGCPISPELATTLFYGIKTDTNEMARNATAEDLECYRLLFDRADHRLLSRIEWPDRDPEYFRILHSATQAMTTYGNVGHTHLGQVSTPDHIAEIADLFDSLESIQWMVCSGVFKRQVYYSIRSKNGERAGEAAERIAAAFGGTGGGHSNMAAGRIPLNGLSQEAALEKVVAEIREIFDVKGVEGRKLLALRQEEQE